jgi:hypothetical protein
VDETDGDGNDGGDDSGASIITEGEAA